MKKLTNSFITGAVALVFAILGYQTALLVHYAATAKITANRDHPDTVFVYSDGNGTPAAIKGRNVYRPENKGRNVYRRNAGHSEYAERVRRNTPPRTVQNFHFDPNTVTMDELILLGFSEKQAESIDAYRRKGGRFRRKEDFAKSYVVADSVYSRLEPYIDIPLLDINAADSAAFDSLPGIGGYFASKMVSHRERLGGYSYPEQLMDIYHFDQDKFDGIRDLITISPPDPYKLWSLPADSLFRHPYIGKSARSIVFYRENNPSSAWTVEGLAAAGILSPREAERLSRCVLEKPGNNL